MWNRTNFMNMWARWLINWCFADSWWLLLFENRQENLPLINEVFVPVKISWTKWKCLTVTYSLQYAETAYVENAQFIGRVWTCEVPFTLLAKWWTRTQWSDSEFNGDCLEICIWPKCCRESFNISDVFKWNCLVTYKCLSRLCIF